MYSPIARRPDLAETATPFDKGVSSVSLAGCTIAFDLDGTLVDTAPDLIGTLNRLLAEQGLPALPIASARHLVGRGARYLLQHGFAEAGAALDEDIAPQLVQRFLDEYLAHIADESRPFSGVEATLDQLAADGARLIVCTNKFTGLSEALLDAVGLSGRFSAVVGADRVSQKKPHAAHFIEAVTIAGGDPARALMVGDSDNDVLSAKAAGAPVVAVSFGYTETPPDRLGADALIDRFEELPPIARRLLLAG
jgi:phosphoglycolate phosphatase